jgi:cellulose 1,4-beta-cellobiosidase
MCVTSRAFAQVTHVTNPFVGSTVYVNPDYVSEVDTAIASQASGSSLAAQMAVVKTYPTFVWLDRIAAINGGSVNNGRLGLAAHIEAALAQQSGTQPVVVPLVIYDLPDRDCAALASNGELSIAGGDTPSGYSTALKGTGLQEYEQNFIDPIYNILAQYQDNAKVRFVLVIEDDSLPNMITNTGLSYTLANCVAANNGQTYSQGISMQGVYVLGIQYALNKFHSLANTYNYLDVGHHGWLGWPNNMTAAIPFFYNVAAGTTAGVASVDGFITNTANYGPTVEPYMTATESVGGSEVYTSSFYQYNPYIDEESYAYALDTKLIAAGFPSTLGFLIDTSRNGWGSASRPAAASTSNVLNTFVDASRIDLRDDMGQWCNQQNAGIGVPPTVNPGYFANLQAYVWVKPPGESDGTYPGAVYNGTTETGGDPNCNPAHQNALANNKAVNSIPNAPPAGTFWDTEFNMLVENAYPAISTGSLTATTTSLASSSVSTSTGTNITLTATVSPSTATGTITFYSGSTALGTATLSSGTATFTTSFATAGTYSLTAVYGGSTAYSTSTSSAISVTVTASSLTATTTTLSTSTTTPTAGSNFTLTVSVSPSTATGTVTFYAGSTVLGTATLSSGTATLSASISAAGIYSLTAVYSGSIRYATSTSNSVPVTVSGASLACHVTYTINNQWPGGFGAALAIKNTGTTAWTSWTLTWTFANGQTVSQFWGGNETQSGANIMVTNMSYNGSLAAGASYTGAGFNGTWNSVTNAVPTSFAINGTVCQ